MNHVSLDLTNVHRRASARELFNGIKRDAEYILGGAVSAIITVFPAALLGEAAFNPEKTGTHWEAYLPGVGLYLAINLGLFAYAVRRSATTVLFRRLAHDNPSVTYIEDQKARGDFPHTTPLYAQGSCFRSGIAAKDQSWALGDFTVSDVSGRDIHTIGMAFVKVRKSYKYLVLSSKESQLFFDEMTEDGTTAVTLEGNFNKYFDVFVKEKHPSMAQYILPPDVMAGFIDLAQGFNIMFRGDTVLIFGNMVGQTYGKDRDRVARSVALINFCRDKL